MNVQPTSNKNKGKISLVSETHVSNYVKEVK